jgi:asparagine synthase (glutamine-hydrolysing)
MCGIAGLVDISGNPVDPELLVSMTDAIYHRGPDDGGFALIDQSTLRLETYAATDSPAAVRQAQATFIPPNLELKGNIGLAHRRFSIIDLSPAGHQPFLDSTRSYCLVYNGEIYNYIELREDLESHGIIFRSSSDTEVLLEGYKLWGVECFNRLNGFWALALYDMRKNRLILSRDRLGKKPLYWSKVQSRVYFASEIKSLLRVPEIARNVNINKEATWYWCTSGLRDLDSSTFFEGIHSLPSASFTVVDENFPNQIKKYWEAPKKRLRETDISVPEASHGLLETLEDAVRIRLRADVPIAIMLSGGMDSSAVLALAARTHPQKLTTFTVKYSDPHWDEEPFARSVASYYDVDYRVIEPPIDAFWDQILAFTYLEEEPYHSPNLQTSQVIWSLMRAEGIKVGLTGAAGDEQFAGYSKYYKIAQRDNWKSFRFGQFIDNALHWSERQRNIWDIRSTLVRPLRRLLSRSRALLQTAKVPTEQDRFPLLKNIPKQNALRGENLTDALYNDITNTLIPYWLRSGDKGYMAIPLESRQPFLDYRMVEFSMLLPETYLIRHGWHKWILRKAFEAILPSDVVWRKRKMGFPFPYSTFYDKYSDVIAHILNRARNPYIDLSAKDKLMRNWKFISFILWYELFFNKNIALFEDIERMIRTYHEPINTSVGYRPLFLNTYRNLSRYI